MPLEKSIGSDHSFFFLKLQAIDQTKLLKVARPGKRKVQKYLNVKGNKKTVLHDTSLRLAEL